MFDKVNAKTSITVARKHLGATKRGPLSECRRIVGSYCSMVTEQKQYKVTAIVTNIINGHGSSALHWARNTNTRDIVSTITRSMNVR